ncbi:hypothetical protein SAMN02799631_06511 [Methylobacterium sp. 174MFSha1.1]|uniref:hypothetical protein n=1 Tax=Methylobacterium sp. 174MFSha1.1 TaxID=1502749 RepID=UPI0008E6EDA1|nr:hypothetical protein [Methylobacterium sp. 174MFSha1.1]SFV16762.1 hypothetical protein SAMN02799631_06511 [Methylobacterium sp. 174MFSha1.1]
MTPANTFGLPVQAPAERPSLVFCSDLSPLDYSRIVHPQGTPGSVAFCGPATSRKTGKPTWHDSRWSTYALATRTCDVGQHRFMSFATWPRQNRGEPKPKRTTENAVSIGASWVDLDFYNEPDWKDVSPLVVLEAVLNVCQDRAWPAPSYATSSGRGLLVAWLYACQPAQAVLARHRAIQETLHQTFRSMGSDPSAKTITKVFRMPKTRNERNGAIVGILWPTYIREIQPTTFDALAEAVLPYRRKTKKEKDAEAAAAKAERTAKVLAARAPRKQHAGAKLGGRSYWATLREDLERLQAVRHGTGSVPDGEGRNAWILALTYAAAWDMPASALDRYVRDQAARCGLTEAEALDKTVTLRAKAQVAARGERILKGTRKLDPRYRPAPGYFVELLDIESREMKRADLRMLIDGARRASNAIGRVVKARRAAGVQARSDQQAVRLHIGQQVEEMVELGMRQADVAALYGVSVRWVTSALRDARQVAAIGKVTAEPAPVPESEVEAAIVVDDVAETLNVPAASATHEVLRGTRCLVPEFGGAGHS